MSDLVTVKSATDDGKVVLWERHPDHPSQEAYVAGISPVVVALTDEVQRRIKSGALVLVKEDAKPVPLNAPAPEFLGMPTFGTKANDEPAEESALTDDSSGNEFSFESKPKRKAKS